MKPQSKKIHTPLSGPITEQSKARTQLLRISFDVYLNIGLMEKRQ